jgi:hypothetical protein
MTLKTRKRNLTAAAAVARADLADFVRAKRTPLAVDLSNQQQAILGSIRRDGYAVVPDYWPRERALAMRDRLESYLEIGQNHEFEEGAYLRFWDGNATDSGVRRIYHIERLVPELAEFRHDPFVSEVVAAYYGQRFSSGVLVFQHNLASNNVTRFYHVDAFSKEFKAFLYLDDVTTGNGPFAYLRGSHRLYLRRLKKIATAGEGISTGFAPDEVRAYLENEVQIEGEAGTLILADVLGLHRGTAQVEGSRSVLVNYLYHGSGDLLLDR